MKQTLFVISLIFVIPCQDTAKQTFILPDKNTELIAGDSIKTWKLTKRFNKGYRMNMGNCFLSYRISYQRNSRMRDNSSENFECGKSLSASWKIITNNQGSFIKLESEEIPELLRIDENYKYFRILALSENELVIKFKHKQYSNNSAIITDYLVPENVKAENRNFHNR